MSTIAVVGQNIKATNWTNTLRDFAPPIATNLILPYPPSVNELFAHVPSSHGGMIRVKTKKYKDWSKQAGMLINAQRQQIIAHPGRVYVQYYVTPPRTKHRRDLANTEKACSDALVEYQVIRDDSLIEQLDMRWDREWPDIGVRVTVSNWPEAV